MCYKQNITLGDSMDRKTAKEQGLKHYHGKPCKKCNETLKYVSNWSCVSCETQRTKDRDPEVFKRYIKSDKGQEWLKDYRRSDVYRCGQGKWKRRHYDKHKDKYHGYNLKKYNLTPEEYDQMYKDQDGKCYVCNKEEARGRKLAVDHNHDTGHNRKLLCSKCNTALGLLKEDTETMQNLIEYVKTH